MGERSESDCSIDPSSVEDGSKQLLRDSGSTASSAIVRPALATFHGLVYKHYFEVVGEDSKNLRVHCKLCGGSKTLLSARNSTSNFKKHLNTVHKSVKLVAREVNKPENKRRRSADTDDSEPKELHPCTKDAVFTIRICDRRYATIVHNRVTCFSKFHQIYMYHPYSRQKIFY